MKKTLDELDEHILCLSKQKQTASDEVAAIKKQVDLLVRDKKQSELYSNSLKSAVAINRSSNSFLRRDLHKFQCRVSRGMKKLDEVRIAEANLGKPEWRVFSFSKRKAISRQKTVFTYDLVGRTRNSRCKEVFDLASLSAGSGDTPCLNLLMETIVNKYSPESVVEAIHHSPLKKVSKIKNGIKSYPPYAYPWPVLHVHLVSAL